MIPQGEFRKLISENSKEREEILQRIFRTYFYERMTEALKDEAKQLKENLQQTEWKEQQQISKIEWRTQVPAESDSVPETMQKLQLELEAITASIKEGEQELVEHKKNWQERQQQYYEAKQLLDIFQQLEQALVQKEQLEQKSPDIEQKKQQLMNMERASRLLPYERQLAARKQEWQRQTKAQQETKERKDLIEKQYITIKSSYTQAKEQEPKRLKRQEQLQLEKQQFEQWKEYEKRKLELVRIQKTLADKQQRLLKLNDAHADKKIKQSKLEQDVSGEAALIQAFFEEQGTYEKE